MPMASKMKGESSSSILVEAHAHIWANIFKFMDSLSLKCAVQLHIPDIIHSHGRPMTLSNLVEALQIHPTKAEPLGRLMRLLTRSGFFSETHAGEDDTEVAYILTPPSRLLLRSEPLGAAPFLLMIHDTAIMAPWDFLSSWFHSTDHINPFETAHGRSLWEYVAGEPVFKNVFHEAMVSDSKLVADVVVRECGGVFEGVVSLVDVGGGSGTMGRAIAEAFPCIDCTVYDLPVVVDGLRGTENLRFEGGDMFKTIPRANAVLLKWILHDWDDEDSMRILKNCREAIPSRAEGGKLIVIDIVMGNLHGPEGKSSSTEIQQGFDMLMLMCTTGKERDFNQWETLFQSAGFTGFNIVHHIGTRALMEVYP